MAVLRIFHEEIFPVVTPSLKEIVARLNQEIVVAKRWNDVMVRAKIPRQ